MSTGQAPVPTHTPVRGQVPRAVVMIAPSTAPCKYIVMATVIWITRLQIQSLATGLVAGFLPRPWLMNQALARLYVSQQRRDESALENGEMEPSPLMELFRVCGQALTKHYELYSEKLSLGSKSRLYRNCPESKVTVCVTCSGGPTAGRRRRRGLASGSTASSPQSSSSQHSPPRSSASDGQCIRHFCGR
jgi:hypothetical protein